MTKKIVHEKVNQIIMQVSKYKYHVIFLVLLLVPMIFAGATTHVRAGGGDFFCKGIIDSLGKINDSYNDYPDTNQLKLAFYMYNNKTKPFIHEYIGITFVDSSSKEEKVKNIIINAIIVKQE